DRNRCPAGPSRPAGTGRATLRNQVAVVALALGSLSEILRRGSGGVAGRTVSETPLKRHDSFIRRGGPSRETLGSENPVGPRGRVRDVVSQPQLVVPCASQRVLLRLWFACMQGCGPCCGTRPKRRTWTGPSRACRTSRPTARRVRAKARRRRQRKSAPT